MLRALLVGSVLLSACAVDDPDAEGVRTLGIGEHAGSDDGRLRVITGGLWYRSLGCPSPDPATCQREGHFWVDLEIRNDAYDKRVGIVWIDRVRDDADAAWHVATAVYERPLAANLEQWGVDVTTGVMSGIEPAPQIELAAYLEMDGATSWDNNAGENHLIP